MVRKIAVGVCFVFPLALLVWQEYGTLIGAHLRSGPVAGPVVREHEWARPVSAPPLENCFRVAEDLYRGAQPTGEGIRRLKQMGVRTIVNLRRMRTDADEADGAEVRTVDIYVNPAKPREEQVVAFLRIVSDPNCTPVYVHCQRGIDRTGMMCAAYRMLICGWSKQEAIDEMTRGPFGYDAVFVNVPEFLRGLDVEALRREVRRR